MALSKKTEIGQSKRSHGGPELEDEEEALPLRQDRRRVEGDLCLESSDMESDTPL